jgi:hypothetical protein
MIIEEIIRNPELFIGPGAFYAGWHFAWKYRSKIADQDTRNKYEQIEKLFAHIQTLELKLEKAHQDQLSQAFGYLKKLEKYSD